VAAGVLTGVLIDVLTGVLIDVLTGVPTGVLTGDSNGNTKTHILLIKACNT
jgi:hypothetical protein